MESKIKFKPNPEYRLMDQGREVLRCYHYAYRTVLLLLDITAYKILWRQNTSVYKSFVEKTFPVIFGL